MARSKSLPDYVLHVRTYAELEQYARAFAQGYLNLLMLCGAAGLGKSRCLRRAVGDKACWIDGNATAFGIYLEAYEYCHRPIILDDVDGLYRDRNGIRLLKSLGQTEKVKSLSWQTDAKTLERRGVPRQFTTTSRVVIIANRWLSLNADVAALEDRGHFLLFEPSALEVHRQAGGWFWDQQVFDFVGDHLHLMERPSLRTYVRAWELKQAGLDWRQGVLCRCVTGLALEVARLKADPAYPSEEDRVRAFVASDAGCRATYFHHAKKLQPRVGRPEMRLAHSAPPPESTPDPDILDRLRRRFRYPENN
jgi:hypothetical protein